MKTNVRIQAALDFAARKHAGQLRIGGAPYISHPKAVAEIVHSWNCGEAYIIAALFHDLLEDTDAREDEILALGGAEVLKAVQLLTKRSGYIMSEYIADIRSNPIARVVKAADRLHNLRCAADAPEAFRRKYIRESRDWYMDFCPEIPQAVAALEASLDE